MLFSTIFTTAAFAASALASTAAPATFKLKAVSTASPPDSRFNNLEIDSYHTGAGEGTALLSSGTSGTVFYQNGTRILSNIYNPGNSPGAASFSIPQAGTYTNFDGPATISVGEASNGYAFKNGHLVVTNNSRWLGWLACKWNLGDAAPQIFYLSYGAEIIPGNCGAVNLVKA